MMNFGKQGRKKKQKKQPYFFSLFVFHLHIDQPRVIRCFQTFRSPSPFRRTCFFAFVFAPAIIEIAINSICVPRCFSRAAAASALQKTNIHCCQARSGRPLMRGAPLPLRCVTVLKSLHGEELINFFSSSSVLVCLRKTKTARSSSAVSSVVLPLFQSALLGDLHPALLPPAFPARACFTISHWRRVISAAIIKQMKPIQNKNSWHVVGMKSCLDLVIQTVM